jgi:hypothetical protein
MDTVIEVFGVTVRADFFLVVLSIVFATFVALLQTYMRVSRDRARSKAVSDPLIEALSRPEVVELLKSQNLTLKEFVDYFQREPDSKAASGSPITSLISKISSDIQWDVAGVIGLGVTLVLLFMVVSGTIDQVPEKIYTGWLLILGYYFGKSHQAVAPAS